MSRKVHQGPDADGTAAASGRRSRLLLAAGVAATVTLAAAGFALGRDVSASRAHAHPGSAWLATTGDGTVNLVDGISGGSAAKVSVPGASGHAMAVTQSGDLVFVRDTVSGAITVVDTSQLLAGVQIPHSPGTAVLAGGGIAYLVDATGGTVQRVDPTTLAAAGDQVKLKGSLGTPVVDHNGVLWAPVLADGTVVPVSGAGAGTPIAVDPAGSDMVMALADNVPAVVDRTAGTLTAINGGRAGEVVKLPGAADSGDRLQVASVDGDQPLPLLETGTVAQLVLVNLGTGTPTAVGLPAPYTSDDLAPPLQAGQRTYIPDYTRGTVLVYDDAGSRFGSPIQVLARGGQFEAEIVDGIVYFNDPSGQTAVSVSDDGVPHDIRKDGRTVPNPDATTSAAAPDTGDGQGSDTTTSTPTHDRTTGAPPTTGQALPTSAPAVPTSVPAVVTGTTGPPAPVVTTTPTTSAPKPTHTSKSPAPPTTTTPPPTTTSSPAAPTGPKMAPAAVKVAPTATGGTVTVSWQNPSDTSGIASYRVSVSPNAGKQSPVAGNPLAVTFTGLSCGQVYSFTVTAVGPAPDHLTKAAPPVTNRACTAPGVPRNVALSTTAGNATDLHVAWSAPSNPGVGALAYIVTLSGPNAPGARTVNGTSTTFTGLVPGHPYTVSVRAQTAGGTSGAATASGAAGNAAGLTVNLNAIKGYYSWGPNVHCTYPNCPTWIQISPSSYTDTSSHGHWVTTVMNGAHINGYCYNHGYNARADNGTTYSDIWIYVAANGHYGYASSFWFTNSANTFGLPLCPGGTPTG